VSKFGGILSHNLLIISLKKFLLARLILQNKRKQKEEEKRIGDKNLSWKAGPPRFGWFVAFGVLTGCVAWLTTSGIYWFEDLFDRMPGNY
jgi:hypothetical protein